MNKFIVSTGLNAAVITNSQEAVEKRDDLLQAAEHLLTVNDAEEAKNAADTLKEIKNFTRMIEATRSDVKAPILDLGKKVDALAKELTAKLDAEASRIGNTLAAWQTEQNRIAEELKRKAWEEEMRIKREAEEKERAAAAEAQRIAEEQAAEARRLQAELDAKAERARTEAGRQRALEEAENARFEADKRERERKAAEEKAALARQEAATAAVIETRVAVAAVAPAKQAGVATKRTPKFEVTDIVALYEACPFMVKLVPNDAVIIAAIKNLKGDEHLPGIRHYWETSSIVR